MILGKIVGETIKRMYVISGIKPDFNEPVTEVPQNVPRNKYMALARALLPFKTMTKMSERIVEYSFVLSNMQLPIKSKILEVGSCRSMVALQLASMGYKVTACDLKYYKYTHPNLEFVQGDLRNLDLPKNYFNAVIAISTIEHSGMGAYQDKVSKNGDKQAIQKIHDLLKPKGVILVTVPFGKKRITKEERIYDKASLFTLLKNFKNIKIQYYQGLNRTFWVPTTEKELIKNKDSSKGFVEGVACIVAQKK